MRTLLYVLLPCIILGFSACGEDTTDSFVPQSESNLSLTFDGVESTYRFGYQTELTNENTSPRALIPYQQTFILTPEDLAQNGVLADSSNAIVISIGRQFNRPVDNFRFDLEEGDPFSTTENEIFSVYVASATNLKFETGERDGISFATGGVLIISTDAETRQKSIYLDAEVGADSDEIRGEWKGTLVEVVVPFLQ